jgi:hypothetical protein
MYVACQKLSIQECHCWHQWTTCWQQKMEAKEHDLQSLLLKRLVTVNKTKLFYTFTVGAKIKYLRVIEKSVSSKKETVISYWTYAFRSAIVSDHILSFVNFAMYNFKIRLFKFHTCMYVCASRTARL